MTVRDYYDGSRHDERFVCQWHINYEGGCVTSMTWCGLDCTSQRMRVAREMEDSSMDDREDEIVYPAHMPGETVMAPVTWDEWRALLDVAEAVESELAYKFTSTTRRLHFPKSSAALDRLEEVRRD